MRSGTRLSVIAANTPQNYVMSFGSDTFLLRDPALVETAKRLFGLDDPRSISVVMALAAAISAFLLTLLQGPARGTPPASRRSPSHLRGDFAIACGAAFCLTFTLGSNFYYRLIILAAMLPALLDRYEKNRDRRCAAAAALLIGTLWLSRVHHFIAGLSAVYDAMTWAIFIGTVTCLATLTLQTQGTATQVNPRQANAS